MVLDKLNEKRNFVLNYQLFLQPFSDADMARSLLYLVSNDIGHIVTLYAMLHKVKNIYFGGFFLRYTIEFLSLKARQICIFEVQFLQIHITGTTR